MMFIRYAIRRLAWFAVAGVLLGCSLFQSLAEKTPEQTTPTQSPAETAIRTSLPTEAQNISGQDAAMLISERAELGSLGGIPAYEISIDIDYEQRSFSGRSAVDLTNLEAEPLQSLYFRLLPNGGKSYGPGRLEVTAALLDGKPAQLEETGDATVIQIDLPEPLEVGSQIRVEFEFNGEVPSEFGAGDSGGYGIFNYSGGVMALSGWFPILAVYDKDGWNLDPVSAIGDSVYSDAAFYTVAIRTPADLTVIATGVETEQQADGNQTLHNYVSGPVRDFFIILSSDFELASGEENGTRVNAYTLPGHKEAGEQALQIALDSLRVFNQNFGAYPYAEFDVVEAPMRYALGVEFPGIVLVASQLYDEQNDSFVIAGAHEVAHQWWYNVVGNDVFDEPWLDESLATYASAVYFQEIFGEQAYQSFVEYWQGRYAQLVERGADQPVARSLSYFESLDSSGVYGGVAYTKGALFLKELREYIGDKAFFEALQAYYARNSYQIASADDLLSEFEKASGKDLDALYQKWLYSPEK